MKERKKYRYTEREGTPMAYYVFVKVILVLGVIVRAFNLFNSFLDAAYDFWFGYSVIFAIIQLFLTAAALIGLFEMKWYGPICFLSNFCLLCLDALIALAISVYFGTDGAATYLGSFLGILVWLIPSWIYFRKRRLLFAPPPADDPRISESEEAAAPGADVSEDRPAAASAPVSPSDRFASAYEAPAAQTAERSSPADGMQGIPGEFSSENGFGDFVNSAEPNREDPAAPRAHPPVLFCRKCGKRLLPDSTFCSYCGSSTEV